MAAENLAGGALADSVAAGHEELADFAGAVAEAAGHGEPAMIKHRTEPGNIRLDRRPEEIPATGNRQSGPAAHPGRH